ncbi:glycoside hydrolase family 19 protein [Nocardia cyriacigeorgica]|uniref:glycoside hydrolase family 19 protein n=1 Tax=Nocardia cyriacigeorgica TaxID=135487 RepID=UPI002454A76B|nr:glycoside hydrolase family 19 protein [Nocardia cyriacigeorgica]
MVDQLGVGEPADMPDVTQLLSKAGLYDPKSTSIAMSAYDDNEGEIAKITQNLVARDKDVSAEVVAAARQGTRLNIDIWDEVVDLREAVAAVGSGKLARDVETALLDTFGLSLQRVWTKYKAATGYIKESRDNIEPITLEQLRALAPKTDRDKLAAYLPHLNTAMREAGIVNPKRKAAFLAQVLHETDKLRTLTEYGDKGYFERNYGPGTTVGRDLGNERPGDGARFRGRGALQITGRYNYEQAGEALDVDLIRDPGLAAKPEHAFDVATWFWESKRLNDDADRVRSTSDFDAITKTINGGGNGLTERREYYDKARKVLGTD